MDNSESVPINNGTNVNPAGKSWDQRVDKAKTSAHSTIDKLSESARPAVDQVAATAHKTVDKISASATQAATALTEKYSQACSTQQQLLDDARVKVREKPMTAIAVAVAAGYLLRQIFRSR